MSVGSFLYLMIGEAFCSLLTSNVVNIKGLQWPWLEEQIVDCQFVDDTTLYLQGSHDNLSHEKLLELLFIGISWWVSR